MMTSLPRTPAWLIVALLATAGTPALSQDSPLYRDPSPTEGRRIEGPLLPPIPPPASDPAASPPPAAEGPGPFREPLLGVPPIPPPQPAMLFAAMQPDGVVEFRRTTKIRGPKGVLGRVHDWARDALLGPPAAEGRGLVGVPRPAPAPAEAPRRFFSWPSWPSWPAPSGR